MASTDFYKPHQHNLSSEGSIQRRRVARVYGEAILMLAPLLMFYWIMPLSDDLHLFYNFVNSILPIYFCFVLALLAARVLKRMPDALWTGVFWFPIQSLVFFGFGPLVEIYGNAITQTSLADHKLAVSEVELFRTNMLSVTGVLFILLGFFGHMKYFSKSWAKSKDVARTNFSMAKFGLLMILLGGFFKYFILLPAQWGFINVTVAGVLSGLGNAVDLGFAIIAYMIASGHRKHTIIFWSLWPLHIALSVITFAKMSVVIAMLLPLLGAYIAHRSRKRFIFGLLIIGFVYASLQPIVHYGRAKIYANTGTISNADYAERVEHLLQFFVSDEEVFNSFVDDRQGWWTRLSSAGPQAQAMALYDQGNYNRTLDQAWMFFIPRAIWPNKPIMVGPGLEFYRMVTGREDANSFLALSIYGDLYWQYGWSGVILGSTLIGVLFAMLSAQSVRIIRRRDFLMLPPVLMALEMMLLGPNKYVLNGIIGPLPIYFAFYVFFNFVSRSLRTKQKLK